MTSSKTRAALISLAVAGASMVAVACGSSNGNTGNLGTAPADCSLLATKFAGAVTGFGTSDNPDIAKVFDDLTKALPHDLQDDAKVLSSTFAKFAAVVQKYNGDMTKALADPDGRAAITAMGSEKNAAANAAIEHYFAVQCPAIGS